MKFQSIKDEMRAMYAAKITQIEFYQPTELSE